jgi:Mn2+/Fe2+ NRAMP family transporter
MPMAKDADETTTERAYSFRLTKLIGPGLIVAATGIGAGDVVSATVAGANYGNLLLWAVVLGAFFKFALNEGIARWQLATEETALEGWVLHLPAFVHWYFALYLVVWTVSVGAALTNACGIGIQNFTRGAVSAHWGAVLHSLAGAAAVLIGGFRGFEKLMKVLICVMFFAIVLCAAVILRNPVEILHGLFVPWIPAGGGMYVLSVIGGVGGSVTLLSYNYWMREEKLAGPRYLRYIRADLGIAYAFTAVFGLSILLIASQAFYAAGIKISNAQAVTGMAQKLSEILGPAGFYVYSLGFWAAVFASLLGVWQSVPYMYADFWGLIRKFPPEKREALRRVTSTPYRLALLYITLAPLPFAFLRQPLAVIVTYTILGSLFVPFVAATLLYLNNKVNWNTTVKRNSLATNGLLVLILLMFAAVGYSEIRSAFGW